MSASGLVMNRLLYALLALIALGLSACDLFVGDPAFTATLGGGVDARLRGSARFETVEGSEAPLVAVLLTADEDQSDVMGTVTFYFRGERLRSDGVPTEGNYAVRNTEGFEANVSIWGILGPMNVAMREGTLSLTSVSAEQLSGTFALVGTTPWGELTTVEGTFATASE